MRLGGRFVEGKTRPVLVKFQSIWDRRLVLGGSRKLSEVPEFRRVFVKMDETVEERRRAVLKRLHARAIREHKDARIENNGSDLYVDSVLAYSLKDGFVESSSVQSSISANNAV
jgi:hypothetical protein